MNFHPVDIREIKESAVKLYDNDNALLTAGTLDKWNTMTISWGGLGELWGYDVAFVFVRPNRYTYEFIENNPLFSLSFFGGGFKEGLKICGSKSGRDIDKAAATGLIPMEFDGTVGFEQAEIMLVCEKIAFYDLNPAGFLDNSINENYPKNDYHRMYVGKIIKTCIK